MKHFKKSSIYLTVILIALYGFTFSGCFKKGDEDPFFSLRTRKARLIGEWDITEWKVDGVSILSETDSYTGYNSFCNSNYTDTETISNTSSFEFEKDGDLEWFISFNEKETLDYTNNSICADENYSDNYSETTLGEWEFEGNGKDELELKFTSFGNSAIWEFEIIGLSNSKLHLEGIIDGEKMEIIAEKE